MQIPVLELVIGFAIFEYFFTFYMKYRQCRMFNLKERPEDLKSLQTPDEFSQSQHYNKDKYSFNFIQEYLDTLLEVLALYFGLYPYIYQATQIVGKNEILRALMFIGILILFHKFFSMPFKLYKTFVIEETHGFNKYTMTLFITDEIKGIFLTVLLGAPLTAGFLWIIIWTGENLVLYVSVFILVVSLLLQAIVPNFIMPLFYTFWELEEGSLKEKIKEMASKLSFPLTKIYVMDGSKRSAHSNAFLYGIWKWKRIVLFDTLLYKEDPDKQEEAKTVYTEDEIVSVICHELGHWKYWHNLISFTVFMAYIVVQLYIFSWVINNEYICKNFLFSECNVFISLFIFSYIYSPVSFLFNLSMVKLVRSYEFAADGFAKKQQFAEALSSCLYKLCKQNKSTLLEDHVYAGFFLTHPGILARVDKLRSD